MNRFLLSATWLVCGLSGIASAAEPRYVAALADGSRVTADEVANWQDMAQQPSIAGKPLHDAGNPVRWILDRTLPAPNEPEAFVEFFTGDRCPGEVLAARDGSEGRIDRTAAHLLVKTGQVLGPNETSDDDVVRVTTEGIQRVVWQASGVREYRPGTVFLRDGRALTFRSLRWMDSGVTLLMDEGVQQYALADLAEVHFPRRDPWDAWFEPLSVLLPEGTGRLIQLECSGGLRVTTSTERFRPQFKGDRNKPENWLHVLQPAWSLDLIWVRYRTVRSWRLSSANQVSLTQLTPASVKQESFFATSVRWQRDRSVPGQSLDVAGNLFPSGLGVQAGNEISFDLHPAVRTFRTRFGLDQAAGEGGCVRGVLFLETDQRRALLRSDVLVGSKTLVDSSVQPLAVSAGQTARLILASDPVLEGRPAGADPFDIRDFVDWMQPELELDSAMVQKEIRKRSFGRVAGLSGWSMPSGDQEKVKLSNHWDESHPRDPRYRVLLSADSPFVTMSGRMRIEKGYKWLAISVTRPPTRTTPVRMQVRAEGIALGEFNVPSHASPLSADPILIPIDRFQGKVVNVEIVQMAEKPDGAVDWRGVATLDRRPGLLRLFEDEAEFVKQLNDGDGAATLESEKPFRGNASLRVTTPRRGNPRIPGLEAGIREYPEFGEYRFIRFAWKQDGGSQIALAVGHHGQFGGEDSRNRNRVRTGTKILRDRRGQPLDERGLQVGYRYDAGKGPPLSGAAIRLGGPDPNWVEVTRDLYADFGNFSLTGLQFICPDGNAAWFDEIYLGRTVQDFEGIREGMTPEVKPTEVNADPNLLVKAAANWDYANAVTPVAPSFSTWTETPASAEPLQLLKEFRGRTTVLRTFGPQDRLPFVLRTTISVPVGKATKLELSAGHEGEENWQLVVVANGQTLHDGTIGPATSREGWVDLSIDLSRFAGQNVLLTSEHRPGAMGRKPGYFSKAHVVIGP